MPQVADLVANLTADISKFKTNLADAVNIAKQRGTQIASGLATGVTGIASWAAGGALALASAWGVTEAVSHQREAKQNELRLQAVMENTGAAFGLGTEDVKKFAHELQAATNIGHQAVIEAATALGRYREIGSGDVFKQTLGLATDLAVVLDRDVVSTARTLGAVLQNPADSFLQIKELGVSLTEAQKTQITNLQQANDLLGAQRVVLAEIDSTVGGSAKAVAEPWRQIGNLTHEIAENVGAALVPSLDEVGLFLRDMIAPGVDDTRKLFIQVGEYLRQNVLVAIDGMRIGMLGVGFTIENWGKVSETVFEWIEKNWFQLIVDIGAANLTLAQNITANLINAFTAVFDYVASGGTKKFEFAGVGLLEGFESGLTKFELPENLKRQWADMVGEATRKTTAERTRLKVPRILPDDDPSKSPLGGKPKREGFVFAEQGSAEAFSTIFRNLNQSQTPADKALMLQQAAVLEAKVQTDLLRTLTVGPWRDAVGVDI